jgi:hypothetical protein
MIHVGALSGSPSVLRHNPNAGENRTRETHFCRFVKVLSRPIQVFSAARP